jgi:hypothetical protein
VRRSFAIVAIVMMNAAASAGDVTWNASVPLWKSLSAKGELMEAGPAPAWLSPPPPARLGVPPRPAPTGTPRPRELPETLVGEQGPTLPPPPSTVRPVHANEKPAARLIPPLP